MTVRYLAADAARLGVAGRGRARPGWAWLGVAGRGVAWRGPARQGKVVGAGGSQRAAGLVYAIPAARRPIEGTNYGEMIR
jgi:hypothetical protein